jgi:hypothetical protein
MQRKGLSTKDQSDAWARAIFAGALVLPIGNAFGVFTLLPPNTIPDFTTLESLGIFAGLAFISALIGAIPAMISVYLVAYVYKKSGRISYSISLLVSLIVTYLVCAPFFGFQWFFFPFFVSPYLLIFFLPGACGAIAATRLLRKRAAQPTLPCQG